MVDYRDLVDRLDLRTLAVPGRRISGNKPVMVKCSWHDDRHASMAIYADHIYCHGCQRRESLLDWLAEQENLDLERDFKGAVEALVAKYGAGALPAPRPVARKMPEKPIRIPPMDAAVARRYHGRLPWDKRQWYRDRGLSDKMIDAQLLGYDGRAFTIPVWHPNGDLLTIRYRRDDLLGGSGPKYWGIEGRNDTLLYNQGALAGSRVVVITEGELDCLRLWQEGIAAVSSTNGTGGMVSIWGRVSSRFRCSRIIIAFDQDEGGRKAGADLLKMINGRNTRSASLSRAVVLRWDKRLGKDITDLAKKKGTAYLKKLIEEASHV